MELIDKAALVAEIDNLKHKVDDRYTYSRGWKDALCMLEAELDTLEVKEVDLEKELSQWWKYERTKDYNVDILYERYPNVSMKLAKHFFELGLRVNQKGEKGMILDSRIESTINDYYPKIEEMLVKLSELSYKKQKIEVNFAIGNIKITVYGAK